MNPRVSRSSRAGLEGHRLPDREDRRPARGRLPPRRDPQRHHRRDAGVASSPRSTTWSPRSRGGRSRSSPAPSPMLGTHMQSVGEVMAIGRTFPESLQKALRSLETRPLRLQLRPGRATSYDAIDDGRAGARGGVGHARAARSTSRPRCARASSIERLVADAPASTRGSSSSLEHLVALRAELRPRDARRASTAASWRQAKRMGFSDAQLAVPAAESPNPTVFAARSRGRGAGHVQDGRHLRRGVRGADAVPLLHLRGRRRGRAARPSPR